MNSSIDDLRKSIRHRRRQLGFGAKCRAAVTLVDKMKSSPAYQRSQHIALYLANDGELSCDFLIKQIWKDGKHCYLPVLAAKQAFPPMLFALYCPGDVLVKNRYGISEPAGTKKRFPEALDLVVMPLVAFDAMGNRVGMGGGYYDRSFAFKRFCKKGNTSKKKHKLPFLIGVAYRLQKVRAIESRPWDVRPDKVLAV